jgi:hypothetical protein
LVRINERVGRSPYAGVLAHDPWVFGGKTLGKTPLTAVLAQALLLDHVSEAAPALRGALSDLARGADENRRPTDFAMVDQKLLDDDPPE